MEQSVYAIVRAKEERHWWFRGRRAVLSALLTRADLAPGAEILDAGCGTGRNLEMYGGLGRAFGVDPAPEAVEFCRERGLRDVQLGDAESLPFEDGRFGLVAATDVLEHVADDSAALQEMRRVARPGATLLLTVPAYGWLWSAEDVRLQHFRRYSLGGLSSAARKGGWEPVFGTYFNTLLLPAIAAARKLPLRSERPELERTSDRLDWLLSLPMQLEANLISAGVRLPAGVSAGLLCRRA